MRRFLFNKKFLILVHSTLPLIILILFGFFIYQDFSLNKAVQEREIIIEQNAQELADKEEEAQLCFQGSAKAEERPRTTYKFEDFGIYSPLFENKEIENIIYSYNGKTIKERRIDLKGGEDSSLKSLGVIAWEFTSVQGGTLANVSEKGLVIFHGYENYANRPTSLESVIDDWKGEYQTKNIGQMSWSFDFGPKQIVAVYLETYLSNSPSSHPIFVRLWYGDLFVQSETDPEINVAKEKLKEVADTLSFTP